MMYGTLFKWYLLDQFMAQAIRREGALTCGQCHTENGVLDWNALGYTEDEISSLQINPME